MLAFACLRCMKTRSDQNVAVWRCLCLFLDLTDEHCHQNWLRFWNQIEDKVAERLEDALSEQFEEIVKMDQVPKKLIPDAFAEQIIDDFKGFLDHEEHGIKTTAARRGVSHLLPRPYARSNPPRPSFIDTGLYRASFRAWTEED